LYRAEEIGISIGMGLTRIRNHSDAYVDNKSKPDYEKMPDWWISSTWIQPESDDKEDEDEIEKNDEENNKADINNNGNNNDRNNDNGYGAEKDNNLDNNDNNNNWDNNGHDVNKT